VAEDNHTMTREQLDKLADRMTAPLMGMTLTRSEAIYVLREVLRDMSSTVIPQMTDLRFTVIDSILSPQEIQKRLLGDPETGQHTDKHGD
jgi:hypothetical protein